MTLSNQRENEELDSCTDVSADSIVTVADAYIEGISLCSGREVYNCTVKPASKSLGELSEWILSGSFLSHVPFLCPGVTEVSSADECNSRCAQEERCLFTSFVKMTNGKKERCYLFEHGAKVLFKKVKGNGDNIKEGKISIFSSKLQGLSGIEALGLQVGFPFKGTKEDKFQVRRITPPLRKTRANTHAQCYNACQKDRWQIFICLEVCMYVQTRACRVSTFCNSGCSDLSALRREKCYFYGKNILVTENFELKLGVGYTLNLFRGI